MYCLKCGKPFHGDCNYCPVCEKETPDLNYNPNLHEIKNYILILLYINPSNYYYIHLGNCWLRNKYRPSS